MVYQPQPLTIEECIEKPHEGLAVRGWQLKDTLGATFAKVIIKDLKNQFKKFGFHTLLDTNIRHPQITDYAIRARLVERYPLCFIPEGGENKSPDAFLIWREALACLQGTEEARVFQPLLAHPAHHARLSPHQASAIIEDVAQHILYHLGKELAEWIDEEGRTQKFSYGSIVPDFKADIWDCLCTANKKKSPHGPLYIRVAWWN